MDGHDHAARIHRTRGSACHQSSSAMPISLAASCSDGPEKPSARRMGERAMRLSPFDPWAWSAFHALTLDTSTRPLRGGRQGRPQGGPVQSGSQHFPYAADGGAGETRAPRRSQGRCGTGFGTATRVPVQPAVFWRRLRGRPSQARSARRFAWCAARMKTRPPVADWARQSIECTATAVNCYCVSSVKPILEGH